MTYINLIAKGIACLVVGIALSSCVSTKKYNQLNAESMRTDSERQRALGRIEQLERNATRDAKEIDRLIKDSASIYNRYESLKNRYEKLIADNSAESSRMLKELQHNQSLLAERESKVAELEQMLRNREEALNSIRRKVADALLGFEGKGLTITQKDGKVYVSMDDKLLFRSGSFDIDPNGAKAVRDLSAVLAQNTDINIVVEGHTDNVPYKSPGQLKDNWDLSVKRATTITRLILENKGIEASRVTAAGRGEYLPLDTANSSEARQKNRRTEIILTPKLDELLKIMEQSSN